MRRGILLDENTGDLLIIDGSLVIGPSDDQNVSVLISASKGEFKHAPALGVGIIDFVKKSSDTSDNLKRRIAVNLKADGYKVSRLSLSPAGELNLDYK